MTERKVLLLGAAGNVGGALWRNLKEKYDIVPFDIRPIAGEPGAILGDITKTADKLRAWETSGCRCVVAIAA